MVCLISFSLANGLRLTHNFIHKKRKIGIEKYYQHSTTFSYPDIESAIQTLAKIDRDNDMGGELVVPRRIMSMMEKKYQSGLSTKELCDLYIQNYFDKEKNE